MAYRPKVLVVENDRRLLEELGSLLRTLGADPHCVASSRQAALRVNKEKFDGVFLRWNLNEISGADLTQMIRRSKSNARIPVAVLTGPDDIRAMVAGFRVGATFSLSHPVGAQELTRLLHASFGAMWTDRRRYQRVPLQIPIHCAWEEQSARGESVNLSVSGLLAAFTPPPDIKSKVALEFRLPGNRAAQELSGLVVRSAPDNQVGIKFGRLAPEQREQLQAYVEQNAPELRLT